LGSMTRFRVEDRQGWGDPVINAGQGGRARSAVFRSAGGETTTGCARKKRGGTVGMKKTANGGRGMLTSQYFFVWKERQKKEPQSGINLLW